MPLSFYCFIFSVICICCSAVAGSKASSRAVKAAAGGVLLTGILVLAGVLLVLMWQAWSPWNLSFEER